jgi:hypothetical protein
MDRIRDATRKRRAAYVQVNAFNQSETGYSYLDLCINLSNWLNAVVTRRWQKTDASSASDTNFYSALEKKLQFSYC